MFLTYLWHPLATFAVKTKADLDFALLQAREAKGKVAPKQDAGISNVFDACCDAL